MEPFVRVTGVAAAMLAANIDTDVIMPKQFLKGIGRERLDEGLFYDLKTNLNGSPRSDFVLNQWPWHDVRFLVVGPNFGCGSSREHAVWGLRQRGIRALIGTSYAGIFFDNCLRNGLLPLTLDPGEVARLGADANNEARNFLTIDLEAQTIDCVDEYQISFSISPSVRSTLLNGLDTVGWTLSDLEAIERFEEQHVRAYPWLCVEKRERDARMVL